MSFKPDPFFSVYSAQTGLLRRIRDDLRAVWAAYCRGFDHGRLPPIV